MPKTDDFDARIIADCVRFGRVNPTPMPDFRYAALQRLTRFRYHLVQTISSEKSRALNLLYLKEYFRQLLLLDISEFQETSFKFIPQNFILKSFFDFQFIYIFIYIVRFFLYIFLFLTYMVTFYLDFFKSPQ
ncbi:IS110 family transposase [Thermoanaerobacterium xylanolyticum]|uniref:IS110 family transposase n=1 Tax=Thermoanaerobacterium xylanolyticum TaxID=29329 RepID=UPI000A04CA3B|nr:transposase [Thermoanaerobacterium xylanolyticum]